MGELTGKTAIVTGAAQGIGRSIAERLLRAGSHVVIADIDSDSAIQVADQLGSDALACQVDVTDEEAVQNLVSTTLHHFGSIDALVNNAAITGNSSLPHGGPILDISVGQWRRMLDVNLTGAFICAKYIGREMVRTGKGTIVNIASIQGVYATRNSGDYSTSKAGLIMLTRVLAGELAEAQIRVNAVAPGPIDTSEEVSSVPARTSATLLGRAGLPDEVAEAVLFLVSDHSSFVDGEILMVDGGAGIRFRESPHLERAPP
jgi:NAD(P)-dependent dehydrogenase (short-subunit alcohol dehydrogenase family)